MPRKMVIAEPAGASGAFLPRKRPSGPPDATEAQIQRAIVDYLQWKGYCLSITDRSRVWDARGRVRASRISMAGYPDLSLVIKGKAVFLEVKSAKGRLSPEQVRCHETLREHGATVFVVRGVDETIQCLAGL